MTKDDRTNKLLDALLQTAHRMAAQQPPQRQETYITIQMLIDELRHHIEAAPKSNARTMVLNLISRVAGRLLRCYRGTSSEQECLKMIADSVATLKEHS